MEIIDDKGNTQLVSYPNDKVTAIYNGKELDLFFIHSTHLDGKVTHLMLWDGSLKIKQI